MVMGHFPGPEACHSFISFKFPVLQGVSLSLSGIVSLTELRALVSYKCLANISRSEKVWFL